MSAEVRHSTGADLVTAVPAQRYSMVEGMHHAVDPSLYRAWKESEQRTPNTVITTGPYMGHALLQTIDTPADVRPAITGFVSSSFSARQIASGLRIAKQEHEARGIVIDVPKEKLLAVYKDGADHMLDAFLILADRPEREHVATAERTERIITFLETGDNLVRTKALLATTKRALSDTKGQTHTITEAWKDEFDASAEGNDQRAPTDQERLGLQRDLNEVISPQVIETGLHEGFTEQQVKDFIFTITNPMLSED